VPQRKMWSVAIWDGGSLLFSFTFSEHMRALINIEHTTSKSLAVLILKQKHQKKKILLFCWKAQ